MIILHSKKIIFFRVPKTGSTSLQSALVNSGMYDPVVDNLAPYLRDSDIQSLHTTPQLAYDAGLLTDEMINTYTMYAVIRNPVDRFVSALNHVVRPVPFKLARSNRMIADRGIDAVGSLFSKPQIDWFTVNGSVVVTPIKYDTCSSSLSVIWKDCGYDLQMPTRNVGSPSRPPTEEIIPPSSDIMNSILTTYAEDWALYNSLPTVSQES